MQIIDFSILESILTSKTYSSNYTNVPFRGIGSTLQAQLRTIIEALGLDLEESGDNFLLVKSQNGVFQKLLVPVVQNIPENLEDGKFNIVQGNQDDLKNGAIRLGNNLISLNYLNNIKEFEIEFEAGNNNSAPYLLLILNADEEKGEVDDLGVYFPLFIKDYQNMPKTIEIKKAFSKGNLGHFLGDVKQGNPTIKITELEEHSEHIIVGYEERDTNFGTQYTITTDKGVKIYANTNVSKVLKASPNISQEMPATLMIGSKKQTKNKHIMVDAILSPQSFNTGEEFDLNW